MKSKTFIKEFEVHYYEISRFQEASAISIFNYLEETAIAHSESVGYGISRLKELNFGWVLYKWNVSICRYPVWGERISVETWPSSFDKFYATREFLVRDGNGKVIAAATSRWIFLNTERKRPARIPVEISSAYGINSVRVMEDVAEEIMAVKDLADKKEFSVRRSDIDTNNHVNNTKYLEWMMEGIEDNIYDNSFLSYIEIEYKKETNYGDNICVCNSNGIVDGLFRKFYHSVTNMEGSIGYATAKTIWKKRGANG